MKQLNESKIHNKAFHLNCTVYLTPTVMYNCLIFPLHC